MELNLGEVALLVGAIGLPGVMVVAMVLTFTKRRKRSRESWDPHLR